jgi:hypothetical protein
MAYAAIAEPSRRADIWFDGPARQRRWTVLLRLILIIPQAIVVLLLEFGLVVVLPIGWFGALFMGRLPLWCHRYMTGFTRWVTRVSAYGYLLTDRYPPFTVEDETYPARPIMPPNGKLNRFAVFFRIILAIPAYVFQAIVGYGLTAPLLLVSWIIVLFTGRMPNALYWAYSAYIRFETRFYAYVFLLTPEYPWGMLGESAPAAPPPYPWPAAPWPPAGPPVPTSPMPYDETPASSTTTAGTDGAPVDASGSVEGRPESIAEAAAPLPPPAPPAWPPPPPPPFGGVGLAPPPQPPGGPPDRGRLVLPRAARGWLIFAIVWGTILYAGQITLQITVRTNNNTLQTQYNTVVNDFNSSKAAIQNAINTSRHCTTVSCLRGSHLAAAASLAHFDSDLKSMKLPSNAVAPAQVVESDLTQLESAFTQLANSANAQAYTSIVQRSGLNTLLQSLPNDTNSLLSSLNQSVI